MEYCLILHNFDACILKWHPEHSPGPYFLRQPDLHFSRAETPRSEEQQGHALRHQPPELLCLPPEMAVQGQAASKGDLQNRQLLYTMRLQAPSSYPTWLSIPTPTARFLSVFKVMSMLLFVCFTLLEQQWISKTFDSNCINWHVGDFVKARKYLPGWWYLRDTSTATLYRQSTYYVHKFYLERLMRDTLLPVLWKSSNKIFLMTKNSRKMVEFDIKCQKAYMKLNLERFTIYVKLYQSSWIVALWKGNPVNIWFLLRQFSFRTIRYLLCPSSKAGLVFDCLWKVKLLQESLFNYVQTPNLGL